MVTVTPLKPSEVETVDRHLPLSRLDQQVEERSMYLIAWEDAQPVGHAHLAWSGTHLGLPEIQDVFVVPEKRRRGIATQLTHAAEEEARARGWSSISLSVSQEGNEAATAPLRETRLHRTQAPIPSGCPDRSCCEAVHSTWTTRSCISRSSSEVREVTHTAH